ncbi:MAG: tetratricopeptide repeat protein [Gammaproteobacteria bacterium]|nr:MAG: tetratricopeptide repeat protein [Gammaproteobacteria bacterium]
MDMLQSLLKLYDEGQDNVLLRFSLGNEYYKAGRYDEAEHHLRAALAHDPHYSVAWKILGRTLADAGRPLEAIGVFEQGIEVAEARGDIQAAKEMRVFLKRARKAAEAGSDAG